MEGGVEGVRDVKGEVSADLFIGVCCTGRGVI